MKSIHLNSYLVVKTTITLQYIMFKFCPMFEPDMPDEKWPD